MKSLVKCHPEPLPLKDEPLSLVTIPTSLMQGGLHNGKPTILFEAEDPNDPSGRVIQLRFYCEDIRQSVMILEPYAEKPKRVRSKKPTPKATAQLSKEVS